MLFDSFEKLLKDIKYVSQYKKFIFGELEYMGICLERY